MPGITVGLGSLHSNRGSGESCSLYQNKKQMNEQDNLRVVGTVKKIKQP